MAEIRESAANACIPPLRIRLRHSHDELANLDHDPGPSGLFPSRAVVPVPSINSTYWKIRISFLRDFGNESVAIASCPKMRTEPKSRILEAFSKFAETSRRGTGSAIGVPEQSSPLDHSFRPAGAPELLCGGTVVIAEQAAQSLTTSHLPVRTANAFFRFGCLRGLLLVMCTHPFAKKALTGTYFVAGP